MKIRVSYTYQLDDSDLKALTRYHRETLTPDFIRQLLADLGRSGIEDQIVTGMAWLEQH